MIQRTYFPKTAKSLGNFEITNGNIRCQFCTKYFCEYMEKIKIKIVVFPGYIIE